MRSRSRARRWWRSRQHNHHVSSHVEQIKEKLGIVDVVGSYVQLEKAGANFKAKCPFHNEKSPSFFVSPTRNTYYCFGCGAKGDIISFVQEFEGLDFIGALRILAKRAGVELVRENPQVRTERERMYLAMEHATLFYQRQLQGNPAALEYLKKRGLSEESVKEWRLGYAPNDWRALSAYMAGKKFSVAEIEKVGLAKRSEKNPNEAYDRFRGRVMFPIMDGSGRVVAFSGRQFESDGTEAKYLNSPETPLFEKSHILYGYDRAKLDIRRKGFAILVEGQMDLLMSHQVGWTNAVATSGTALTADHIVILRRLADKLVIAYDGDAAGQGAAARGWQLALAQGFEVSIAVLPDGKDPADLALQDPAAYGKVIESARHIVDVELDRIMKGVADDRERAKAIEKELLPYVATVESLAETAHFVGKIAHRSGIKEDIVWDIVRNLRSKSPKGDSSQGSGIGKPKRSRRESLARSLLGIVYWIERQNKGLDIRVRAGSIIGNAEFAALDAAMEPFRDELMFEAEASNHDESTLASYADELASGIREEALRDEFAEAMRKLQDAERDKDSDAAHKLLKRCQEITEELSNLKKRYV